MADGAEVALPLVEALAAELDGYHLLHATRADLLRRIGRRNDAASAYARALELSSNDAERTYLARRLTEVGNGGGDL